MSVNAKVYREQLYRLRAHPMHGAGSHHTIDRRDSFVTVYLSLIPFAFFEFTNHSETSFIPSGLIFPTSYLLFWAVYYSYYRPGYLEERLTAPKKWDMMAVPTILIGVTIWFVKVTVIELGHFLLSSLFDTRPKARPMPQRARAHSFPHRNSSQNSSRRMPEPQAAWRAPLPRETEGTIFYQARPREAKAESTAKAEPTRIYRAAAGGARVQAAEAVEEITRSFPQPPPLRPAVLPKEIQDSLAILGLREGVSWDDVHRRYRQLAKQFHPDLHPEVTGAGRRFMMYDSAYRRLVAAKARYFHRR